MAGGGEVAMSKIKIAKLGPRVEILIPIDAARSRDLENQGFGQQIVFFQGKSGFSPLVGSDA